MFKKTLKSLIGVILCLAIVCAFASCAKKADTETTVKPIIEDVMQVPEERVAAKTVEPASSFAGGDGSEQSPYQISSVGELALLAKIFNGDDDEHYKIADYAGKNYVLTKDIIINNNDEMKHAQTKAPTFAWTPIGQKDTKSGKGEGFKGIFDGANHSISGIYVVTDYNSVTGRGANVGLFANTENADIKNVTLNNSHYYSYNQINAIAPIIASATQSTVTNCHTKGCYVFANVAEIGGLIGNTVGSATITGCSTAGKVESKKASSIGGIISNLSDGTIEKCVNAATVINHTGDAGGICAVLMDSAKQNSWEKSALCVGKTTINSCKNSGSITADNGRCGGIAGAASSANSSTVIMECNNNGSVNGKVKAGGIVGAVSTTKNTVDKKADHQGSLLIENCENTGSIASGNYCAGIAGTVSADDASKITIKKCVNKGTFEKSNTVGGIIAFVFGAGAFGDAQSTVSIESCTNESDINIQGNTGGVIAYYAAMSENSSQKTIIKNCVNNGNIVCKNGYGQGGFLGNMMINANKEVSLLFENCVNNGNISATMESATVSFVGGFIGQINSSTDESKQFIRCINNGNINITIENTKAADIKSEEDIVYCYVGGVVGCSTKDTVFENCENNGNIKLIKGNEKDVKIDSVCPLIIEDSSDGVFKVIYQQMAENYKKLEK